MQKNLSRRDSRIRIALGALAGVLAVGVLIDAVAVPSRYASYAGVAAVALLANGLTCRCALYRLLGVSTRD